MARILETILPESIRNEGLLFVPQILEDLMRGKLDREFPARLGEGEDPASARTYAFDVARRLYKTFADSLSQANYKVVTRKFVVNLLDNVLGWRFDRDAALAYLDKPFLLPPLDQAKLEEADTPTTERLEQLNFPVIFCPHLCGLDETNTRFHGWGLSSSARSATRFAQEFLNARDEYLWALVTNGKELRLVRDNPSLTRPSFLSFDLSAILGGAGDFPAFAFLWRMLHGSRVDTGGPRSVAAENNSNNQTIKQSNNSLDLSAEHSLWEALHTRSSETGVRALTGLRSGVVTAIEVLGTGFLKLNPELREALQNGSFSAQAYEQELLHLAYRFLFLFIAEERRLLHTPGTSDAVKKIYREGYSMARLRRIAARYAAGSSDRHTDLYEGVRIVFAGLAHGEERLGLTALGGIFSEQQCAHLNTARLANADLIAAMRALRYIDAGKKLFPVNYRDMGSEEFGSVYEGILELVPNYTAATQTFSLVGAAGNNRKTTGSYYTPSSLVEKQVESALVPLIDKCVKSAEPEKSLLALRVIDTSCGSGHFTVAAARRLATALVEVRGGDSSPEAYQRALRDVISSDIYGVDINPLAVELAKITLWIESVVPGQPLSFLDAHFVCGDATLGIDNIKNLENGIPAAAYKQLPGDDKEAAQELGKINRGTLKEMKLDAQLAGQLFADSKSKLAEEYRILEALPENTLAEIDAKKAAYAQFRESASFNNLVRAANLFTAAFLLPKTSVETDVTDLLGDSIQKIKKPDPTIPTTTNLLALLNPNSPLYQKPSDEMLERCDAACRENRVLHWPLVFPAVFENGGFDCILTNPPWDKIKLLEKEYFASRDPEIANAKKADERKKLIANLAQRNSALYEAYLKDKRVLDVTAHFSHESGRYTLGNFGEANLYPLLTETALHLRRGDGSVGIIVPTGICTDDSNKLLFGELVKSHLLTSLYDFENAASGQKIFEAVDSRFRFSLVTVAPSDVIDFACLLGATSDLSEAERHFTLNESDFISINPNTLTAPLFRCKEDASLAKAIYRRVGVFIDNNKETGNPWGAQFMRMFDMTLDSGCFSDIVTPNSAPLYEAKLLNQFDVNWATYEDGVTPRLVTQSEKENFDFKVRPQNWVPTAEVKERLGSLSVGYLIGQRGIGRADDSRTIIATVIPEYGAGNSITFIFTATNAKLKACLLGDLNSLVHDWCARQKIGGANINQFICRQIATLAPTAYTQADVDFIVPRVLELTYTSNSLKPWAEALGYSGEPFKFDPERRAILRAELDARYAKLYGLDERELTYILDPSAVYGPDYPSESFRVLKEKELAEFGEYRTMRLVLEAFRKDSRADG